VVVTETRHVGVHACSFTAQLQSLQRASGLSISSWMFVSPWVLRPCLASHFLEQSGIIVFARRKVRAPSLAEVGRSNSIIRTRTDRNGPIGAQFAASHSMTSETQALSFFVQIRKCYNTFGELSRTGFRSFDVVWGTHCKPPSASPDAEPSGMSDSISDSISIERWHPGTISIVLEFPLGVDDSIRNELQPPRKPPVNPAK
jgi:hypothetical protein